MKQIDFHEGCCNRHNCNRDLNTCCYLQRRENKPNFINLQKIIGG